MQTKFTIAISAVSVALLSVIGSPMPAHAAFPGDNGLIAFGRGGNLWTLDPASGDVDRLTSTERTSEAFPDWDATGTQIAFSRCRGGEFGNCEIWMMDAAARPSRA
jgi:Tol biopolymer transport system component